MRLYFISQNVVIFFYFASFVLMLDVLFLSLGHYLIFKRAFKKWKCFWNLICEVYFMNDCFFKEFYFCKKSLSFEREKVAWILFLCFYVFRQKEHVLGIQFVILNSDDVRKFTNMRSEVRSFLFWRERLHVWCCVVEVRMISDLILICSWGRERSYAIYCEECYIYYWYNAE